MVKKIKINILGIFIFLIGITNTKAYDNFQEILRCDYKAQNYEVVSKVGCTLEELENGKCKVNVTAKSEYQYSFSFGVDKNNNGLTILAKIIDKDGKETTNERSTIINWSSSKKNKYGELSKISSDVLSTYSCPKYVSIEDPGKFLLVGPLYTNAYASNDLQSLIDYNKDGSFWSENKKEEDYFILTLDNETRNNEQFCYYLSKEEDLLNIGKRTITAYFNNESGIYYLSTYDSNKQLIGTEKKQSQEKNCPVFIETNLKESDTGNSIKLYKYNENPNGNLENDELIESLKKELIKKTEVLNELYETFKTSCIVPKTISKNQYESCKSMQHSQDIVYETSKTLINESIGAGISETSAEIINLKNAIKQYENMQNDFSYANKVPTTFVCQYKSNTDDIKLNVIRECDTSMVSCRQKFEIISNNPSVKTETIPYDTVTDSINQTCVTLKNDFTFGKDSLTCNEKLHYDIVDSKVVFISQEMLMKDSWDKTFEITGIEEKTQNGSTNILTDFSAYTKHTNTSYIYGENSECGTHGGLLYNNEPLSCDDFFDQETVEFINNLYFYIEIIAVIAVIALTIKDYAIAILNSDQETMKKNNKKLVQRLVIVVILIILPMLIRFILRLFNIDGFNADDPLCGIIKNYRKVR